MIHEYDNNVFTHEGQCTVDEFRKEIFASKEMIAAVQGLVVYAGYHGDTKGNWDHDFDETEIEKTMQSAAEFPNADVRLIKEPGLSEQQIRDAVARGNVFFTWCDSDAKVKAVMDW
ncbi:hypothetical protein AAD001_08500 [Colwelliaceae bacterium 6471]